MRRSSIDREEKRVTGRNGSNQRWANETEQLDTNDPNQRRLIENTLISVITPPTTYRGIVHGAVA
jgi:hypothetical protein